MNIGKRDIRNTQTDTQEAQKKNASVPEVKETSLTNTAEPKASLQNYSPFNRSQKKEDCYVPKFTSDSYSSPAPTQTQEEWEKIHGGGNIKFG